MLSFSEDAEEKTKKIFVNPMKANKLSGCSQHSNLKKLKQTQVYLFRFERGNILGDEDLIAGCSKYRTSVKCVSLKGLVGRMKKEDFLRLEFQNYSWQVLSQNAKTKEQAINKHLQLKSKVEVHIVNSAKPNYTKKSDS